MRPRETVCVLLANRVGPGSWLTKRPDSAPLKKRMATKRGEEKHNGV